LLSTVPRLRIESGWNFGIFHRDEKFPKKRYNERFVPSECKRDEDLDRRSLNANRAGDDSASPKQDKLQTCPSLKIAEDVRGRMAWTI